jgi:hypothetical protein
VRQEKILRQNGFFIDSHYNRYKSRLVMVEATRGFMGRPLVASRPGQSRRDWPGYPGERGREDRTSKPWVIKRELGNQRTVEISAKVSDFLLTCITVARKKRLNSISKSLGGITPGRFLFLNQVIQSWREARASKTWGPKIELGTQRTIHISPGSLSSRRFLFQNQVNQSGVLNM